MPFSRNIPIQTKGGAESNVQAHQAKVRELMITTDSNNLYVGKGTGNNPVLVADSTVPNRVQKLENQASTLFATDYDDFSNSTKIATNNGLVVSNSKIRPSLTKYNEDFISDININLPLSSDNLSTNNNYVEVISPAPIGYTTTATTTTYNTESLYTEPFSFNGATQIEVTPSITTPTGITGITAPFTYRVIDPSNTNEHLIDSTIDENNDEYVISVNLSSLSSLVFVLTKNNTQTTTWTVAPTRDGVPTAMTALSDTVIKNVAITTDSNYVYVGFPYDDKLRVYRILKSTMVLDSVELNQSWLGTGETGYILSIDLEVVNNRLYIIYSARNLSVNLSRVSFIYRDLATWGTTSTISSVTIITTPTASTELFYKVKLCKSINNQLGYMSLSRKTTNGLVCGIIDAGSSTHPYQFRTTTVGTNNNSVQSFTISANVSCNGNGTMVYDTSNNTFYIIYGTASNTDIRAFRFVNNQTDAGISHAAITTPSEYSTVGNRDIRAIVENTSNVHIFVPNGTRTTLHYVKASFASTFTAVTTNNTAIFGSTTTGLIQSLSVIRTSSSPFRYRMFFKLSNSIYYCDYRDNIQPNISVELMNGSYSTIGSKQTLSNGNTATFNISANSNIALRFEFAYPIYTIFWTNAVTKPYSTYLNNYVITQSAPSNTIAGFGEFISTTLISDRVIKEVTLSATQSLGTDPNNAIEWSVRALSGGDWISINNNETKVIPEIQQGSSLQVKGKLIYGAGITDITTAPYVDRYEVNVKNTLTTNDIVPLQINMLKMGLRLQALTNYTTTNFTKMMIDTFLDQSNIDTANTTAGMWSSTNQWYAAGSTGTFPKLVTGKVETTTGDGVDVVTSAIFMAEHQGPFAPTYYMRRGTGAWQQVQLGTIINFTSGTPTNQIQWKAELPDSCYLLGVAYLYN